MTTGLLRHIKVKLHSTLLTSYLSLIVFGLRKQFRWSSVKCALQLQEIWTVIKLFKRDYWLTMLINDLKIVTLHKFIKTESYQKWVRKLSMVDSFGLTDIMLKYSPDILSSSLDLVIVVSLTIRAYSWREVWFVLPDITGRISTDAARCLKCLISCQSCHGSLHIEQRNPFIQNVNKHSTILKNCLLLLNDTFFTKFFGQSWLEILSKCYLKMPLYITLLWFH